MKTFILRALTGIVYVILLVGCTVFSPLTAYMFYAAVAMACTWEFCHLMNEHYGATVNTPIVSFTSLLLVSACWLMRIGQADGLELLLFAGVSLIFLLVFELYHEAEDPLRNWTLSFAAVLYTALPFGLLPFIAVNYDANEGHNLYEWIYPLALFVFLWANDTGAYLVGSLLGRFVPYKLFPRISPHKSWVGSVGGGLLTLVAAYVVACLRPAELCVWQWLVVGLVVVFFGTWGDLVESLLKRQLGIKDSGHVLPGHGGFLDRFDSALLALPAAVICIMYLLK